MLKYPGHAHDQDFIYRAIRPAPGEFKKHILSQYKYKFETEGRAAANIKLLHIKNTLKSASFNLASSDYEIRSKADQCAKRCGKIIASSSVYAALEYAQAIGINPPDIDPLENLTGLIGRLTCESWWRRALRKKHGRTVEAVALDLNIVNKHKDIYSSNASLNRRRSQKTRNRQILEECLAVNELGQEFTLQELADLSVSNPTIRRGELMTRIAGFEEYAKSLGMVGEFYTHTCPSRFHSALSKTGKRNPKYDGSTPRDGQQYLSVLWQRIRAKLQREGINIFGFRVCEPQQDGTPHWHLLVFVKPEEKQTLRNICRFYNLQDSPNEPGAQKYRFKPVSIDPKRGTAAGYIAKYIAKNIDGFAVDQDLFGNNAELAAARVDAWASTWGIRQFQQVGGPSVSVWRELRRISSDDFKNAPEHLQALHSAADVGNWHRYCELMTENRAQLVKEGAIDLETGEILRRNKYLEPAGDKITGIQFNGLEINTRRFTWEIKSNVKSKSNNGGNEPSSGIGKHTNNNGLDKGVSSVCTGRSDNQCGGRRQGKSASRKDGGTCNEGSSAKSLRAAAAAPWSPVNNCTQVQIEKITNKSESQIFKPGEFAKCKATPKKRLN